MCSGQHLTVSLETSYSRLLETAIHVLNPLNASIKKRNYISTQNHRYLASDQTRKHLKSHQGMRIQIELVFS